MYSPMKDICLQAIFNTLISATPCGHIKTQSAGSQCGMSLISQAGKQDLTGWEHASKVEAAMKVGKEGFRIYRGKWNTLPGDGTVGA